MTIAGVLATKRWMRLAMPDDVSQSVELAKIMETTEHRQAVLLDYLLRMLRHAQWDRHPSRCPAVPKLLRPSKQAKATGYRHDAERKRETRMKLSPERRKEIATKAAAKRWHGQA